MFDGVGFWCWLRLNTRHFFVSCRSLTEVGFLTFDLESSLMEPYWFVGPNTLPPFIQYFLVTLSWVFSLFLFLPVTMFLAAVTVGLCKAVGLLKRKFIDVDVSDKRDQREQAAQFCADKCSGITLLTTNQLQDTVWWFGFEKTTGG